MSIDLNAEVHFHEQNKASVFWESNSSGRVEKLGEIAMCSMFAVRSLSNLGNCETSNTLAATLASMASAIPAFADGTSKDGLTLIPYPGAKGRKWFGAQLRIMENGMSLGYQAKGFGFFGTGLGYYCPMAVLGIVKYLAAKRKDDAVFLTALTDATILTGLSYQDGKITMSNHSEVGKFIVGHTCRSLTD